MTSIPDEPGGLLPAARLAHRPRGRCTIGSRRACGPSELWRVDPAPPLRRRRTTPSLLAVRDQERARAGYRHRWREAPRELLQPVCDRPARASTRQPRQRRGPQGQHDPGAADRRAYPPPPAGGGRGRRFLRANTDRMIKMTCRGRSRWRSRRRTTSTSMRWPRARLRRGGQRGDPGPLRRRRRHRAARRAVDGGAPRAGAPLRAHRP